MTRERTRPIFFITLAFVALFAAMVLTGCTKHSSSKAEVVIEDPLFPEGTVPVFSEGVTGLVFHKEDVLLLPFDPLFGPLNLLPGAPDLPATVQLGPIFFPMIPLQAGLYSTRDQQYELFLLEDTVYTVVPLSVLALLDYDFVPRHDKVVLLDVVGALVYQPKDRFLSIGELHLWRVN